MSKKNKIITKNDAVEALWRMGELSWKLNPVQKQLKQQFDNDTTKTTVVVVSRRTGKTWWLLIESLMICLKKENAVVKFIFPKQKDAKKNIRPLMREILKDCPQDIKPKYNTQDNTFYFQHNGSEIQLAGCDNGNIEGIRGGKADLCVVDEAGFCSDLVYAVRSILSPTIRTTGGRIVMASTPSKSPNHEFITEFMIPYQVSGRLKIFTIYDNPNFDDNIRQEIIEDYPRGEKDPDYRREYLCEILVDEENSICPEFSEVKDDIIIDSFKIPPHRDFYVSMDVGFKDLTVALFGFYNFKEACFYITDELIMNGPEMTTQNLAKELKLKESINFYDQEFEEEIEPYLRVMDNDLKLINDLHQLHALNFIATDKDNKEAAVNNMRIWIQNKRIKIYKRCKHLIYHLEYGQWDKNRKKFKHLSDSPNKEIRGGHVDSVDALSYLVRNIEENHNPYPDDWNELRGPNIFNKRKKSSKMEEIMHTIMNIKR